MSLLRAAGGAGRKELYHPAAPSFVPESRQPEAFITRTITRAAAAIKLGLAKDVVLGDASAVRESSSPATSCSVSG